MPDIEALYKYLDEVHTKSFMWHTHDCFMFTNEAWDRMYGHGWAEDWTKRYVSDTGLYMKRDQLRREFGFNELEEAVDSKLTRVNGIPPKGALVTTNKVRHWVIKQAFGISIGNKAAFVGKGGLKFIPIQHITNAWIQ